jgi:hypothetical protein
MPALRVLLIVLLAAVMDLGSPLLPQGPGELEELEEAAHARARIYRLAREASPATPAPVAPTAAPPPPRPAVVRAPVVRIAAAPIWKIPPRADAPSAPDDH